MSLLPFAGPTPKKKKCSHHVTQLHLFTCLFTPTPLPSLALSITPPFLFPFSPFPFLALSFNSFSAFIILVFPRRNQLLKSRMSTYFPIVAIAFFIFLVAHFNSLFLSLSPCVYLLCSRHRRILISFFSLTLSHSLPLFLPLSFHASRLLFLMRLVGVG